MIDWSEIDTVVLDMDGTLLDLYFDNYFWQEYLPQCWARQCDMDVAEAKSILSPKFRSVEHTLAWYCLDHWSDKLGLDILSLKLDVAHLIQIRPHAEFFLSKLRAMGKKLVLATNAHEKILEVKLKKTSTRKYFDFVVSSHALGEPKEELNFWYALSAIVPFNCARTLLVDDNAIILQTAEDYGICHLLGIAKPDSRLPAQVATKFPHIIDFRKMFA